MTMNPLYTLGVLAMWTVGPIIKKQVLFVLEPPVYAVAHVVLGALVACVAAVHAQVRHKDPVPPHVVALLLLGACVSVTTSVLLAGTGTTLAVGFMKSNGMSMPRFRVREFAAAQSTSSRVSARL